MSGFRPGRKAGLAWERTVRALEAWEEGFRTVIADAVAIMSVAHVFGAFILLIRLFTILVNHSIPFFMLIDAIYLCLILILAFFLAISGPHFLSEWIRLANPANLIRTPHHNIHLLPSIYCPPLSFFGLLFTYFRSLVQAFDLWLIYRVLSVFLHPVVLWCPSLFQTTFLSLILCFLSDFP